MYTKKLGTMAVNLAIVAISLAGVSAQAEESGVSYVGSINIANKSMELIIRDREFTPTFQSLELSVTALMEKFYVSLSLDQSIDDDIESDANKTGLIFYSRSDISLTVGYPLRKRLTLFGGYRKGETTSFYSATNGSFGSSSEGLFMGASTTVGFDHGALGASLAIAKLKGEVSLSEPFVDTSAFVVGSAPPANITGDAVGYSLSLSWTGDLSESTTYSAAYKIHKYEFEDSKLFGGLDLSYDENFSTMSVGLTHFF